MTIGREREAKPALRVPVDTAKSASSANTSNSLVSKTGKMAKTFTYSTSTDFVRAV